MANNVKQELTNTFEKGLNKDLNPINTPNNVLTDCLNGTLITYDGNEYQLQNDKGNYPLKYCKLPENHVPIGTTSYGDILYVVSYNPINGTTQIGSFPSPEQLTLPNNKEDVEVKSILTRSGAGGNYKDLIATYYQLIQFGVTEQYKLYPGDQYQIEDVETGYPYESLKYFIITDENKLIDITDDIKTDGNEHYVTWEVPGWLAFRWELPVIEQCEIFPKSINPESGESKINFRLTSNDQTVLDAYNGNDISIDVNSRAAETPEREIDEYDAIRYFNYTYPLTFDIPEDQQLIITAKPKINCGEREVIYPDADPYIIDCKNRFSKENTQIANEYYTYQVSDNTITFNFNVNASVVTTGEVELYIKAVPIAQYINNNYQIDEAWEWTDISNGNVFDGVGQQIIQVDLPEEFVENILLIRFELTDGMATVYAYKTAICSELINVFTRNDYEDFTKIPVTKWAQKLNQVSIEFTDCVLPTTYQKAGDTIIKSKTNEPTIPSDYIEKFWSIENEDDTSGFFKDGHIELKIKDIFKYELPYKALDGRINGRLKQRYLYNFCTVSFDNNQSYYTVTGSTQQFKGAEFTFTPDDNINPYSTQIIEPSSSMADYAATTANYSKKELVSPWNGESFLALTGQKVAGKQTNFKMYTNRLGFLKAVNDTRDAYTAVDKLNQIWDTFVDEVKNKSNENKSLFYKVEVSNMDEIGNRLHELMLIFKDPAGDPPVAKYSSAIYITNGEIVSKADWINNPSNTAYITADPYTLFINELNKYISDSKIDYSGLNPGPGTIKDGEIYFNTLEIYDAPWYKSVRKDGLLPITSTSTNDAIKAVFKDTGSVAIPTFITVSQGNSGRCTAFSSNRFSHFVAAQNKHSGRGMAGIMFNDTKFGPLFIPLTEYSNTTKWNAKDTAWRRDSDNRIHLGKEAAIYGSRYRTDADSGVPGIVSIMGILNALKINTKKLKPESGYFLQKEETSREITTNIPIELKGNIYINEIRINATNADITTLSENEFPEASLFEFEKSNSLVNYTSNYNYEINRAAGDDVFTNALKLEMDGKVTEMNYVNQIIQSQYNLYPEFEMTKYINAGKSIGYVNGNKENQPLVSKLVDEILRWDPGIEYAGDNASKYDITINSEGFKKMYFICMIDGEIATVDFDFEDMGAEKSDPRLAICHSVVDRDKLLYNYYTEYDETQIEENGAGIWVDPIAPSGGDPITQGVGIYNNSFGYELSDGQNLTSGITYAWRLDLGSELQSKFDNGTLSILWETSDTAALSIDGANNGITCSTTAHSASDEVNITVKITIEISETASTTETITRKVKIT